MGMGEKKHRGKKKKKKKKSRGPQSYRVWCNFFLTVFGALKLGFALAVSFSRLFSSETHSGSDANKENN